MATEATARARWRARAINHGLFAVAPVVITGGLIALSLQLNRFATDFQGNYWIAARAMLRGSSPYVAARLVDVTRAAGFLYPAVGALLIAPFGLLSRSLGGFLFAGLNIAALPVALKMLGVRDWRVYGLVFLWLPVVSAWQTANVTLLLLLGIAVIWRCRDDPRRSGVAMAVLVSAKPITWPLLIWLLATRRYRGIAWAAATGLLINVAAWSIVGFSQIHRYEAVTQAAVGQGNRIGYTVVALLLHLGLASRAALVFGLAPGVAACAGCGIAAHRGHERASMILCIAAILLSTSLVWMHYFVLLVVPLALTRRRLSPAWALPLLMWVCVPTYAPQTWQTAVGLGAALAVIAATLSEPAVRHWRITEPVIARLAYRL